MGTTVRIVTSFRIDEFSPIPWASNVRIPTFLYQVRGDLYTRPSDVQAMCGQHSHRDKTLLWIERTTRRWDSHAYFQNDPRQMLEWFDTDMK